MNRCPSCGAEIPAEAMYCMQCGSASGTTHDAPTTHMRASEISRVGTPPPQSQGTSTGPTTTQADALIETVRAATLGEYEVLTELGRGGMAAVFLAHEIALDRKVAIKVVLPALEQISPGIAERFLREARTAAALSHPHVIPVYAVKQTPELVYFVMKYVRGRTLESVIQDIGALPIPVVRTILNQVGSALDYAHRNGVIHRDIKPANIILDKEGWAVVTDFGIAKVAEAEALTMTGATVGTPQYMSPEQCAGVEVTSASDQYSLGVVAYEMITGKPPFGDKSPLTVMYEHCHTPVPPIAEVMPDCPHEVGEAVMRMLAKEPGDRWPSVDEAVAALGIAAESEQQLVRSQILKIAKRESTNALLQKFHTPASPAPPSRAAPRRPSARTTRDRTPRRRVRLWAIPAGIVVLGAALGLGLMLGRPDAAPPTTEGPATPEPIATTSLAALDLAAPPALVPVGASVQLTATGRDSAGGAVVPPDLTWEVDDANVASVSSTGLLTAHGAGTVRVTARADGQSATATVRIEPPAAAPPPPVAGRQVTRPQPVATIAVAPASPAMRVGESLQLRATLRAADGTPLTNRAIRWTSETPPVATVDAAGVVLARAPGTARITAESENQRVTVDVEVRRAPVAVIAVEPARGTVRVGATLDLSAVTRDASGRSITGVVVSWRSSDARIATVTTNGRVSGIAAGTATIRAVADGVEGTATVTVTPAPAPAQAPAAPRADAAAVDLLRAYEQALESRDVSRVRAAYPGLTRAQADAWERFFGSVSDLEVTHEILDVQSGDSTASVRVRATHMYHAARDEDRTFEFTARLRLVNGRWQIAAIE